MSSDENQREGPLKEQLLEIEHFIVFRFPHSLGNGIKARIKSLGCSWNPLHFGWICPLAKQDEVQKAFQAAGVQGEMQTVPMPKGIIPTNPRIAGRQARLEILEEQIDKDDMQLLKDVYQYDKSLRPEDFAQPPSEEEKSQERIRIERDFHDRLTALRKARESAEQVRNELSHLNADQGEKIFDSDAPLLIADTLIKDQFLWKEKYRTLHYCSDLFWRWDGIRYVEFERT